MKATTPATNKKKPIKATNLSLTPSAKAMAEKLKAAMFRPSVSNVVETLIHEKAVALGLKTLKKAA